MFDRNPYTTFFFVVIVAWGAYRYGPVSQLYAGHVPPEYKEVEECVKEWSSAVTIDCARACANSICMALYSFLLMFVVMFLGCVKLLIDTLLIQ